MKLYRSRTNKQVLGLCGGLAEVWNVDATLLRLVVLVTAFFSAGSILLLYFLAGFVVPVEPVQASAFNDFSSRNFTKESFYHEQQRQAEMHQQQTDFDQMMGELEKKALQKEIEALKQKLAQYEKGDK